MSQPVSDLSDWEILNRMQTRPLLRPEYDVAAEAVRRGLAESPARREEVEHMGPTVSRAEHHVTSAFKALTEVQAQDDGERQFLADLEGQLSQAVRLLRARYGHA